MRRTGGDVEHVARPRVDGVIVEAVFDTAFKDEDRVTCLTPAGFRRAGRVWRAFLITKRDTKAADGFPDFQAVIGWGQRMLGRGEEIGAFAHGGSVAQGRGDGNAGFGGLVGGAALR